MNTDMNAVSTVDFFPNIRLMGCSYKSFNPNPAPTCFKSAERKLCVTHLLGSCETSMIDPENIQGTPRGLANNRT